MKILIICSNLVGDTVLSTGVFKYLQNTYPEASISFVIGPTAKPLLKNLKNIKSIFSIKKKKFNLHWLEILNYTFRTKWDIIIDLRSSLLGYVLINKKKFIFKKSGNIHHVEQLTKSLGFDCSNLEVITNNSEEKIANNLTKKEFKYLVVFPGGNWIPKIWSPDNFNKILLKLVNENKKIKFILVGSTVERKLYYDKIAEGVPKGNLIDFFGESLTQTAALMKKSDLFLGNDSGLMHLSAACGLKSIALFGPTNDKVYAPWGKQNTVIRTKEDHNFFKTTNVDENKSYMDSISVNHVYEIINKTNFLK